MCVVVPVPHWFEAARGELNPHQAAPWLFAAASLLLLLGLALARKKAGPGPLLAALALAAFLAAGLADVVFWHPHAFHGAAYLATAAGITLAIGLVAAWAPRHEEAIGHYAQFFSVLLLTGLIFLAYHEARSIAGPANPMHYDDFHQPPTALTQPASTSQPATAPAF